MIVTKKTKNRIIGYFYTRFETKHLTRTDYPVSRQGNRRNRGTRAPESQLSGTSRLIPLKLKYILAKFADKWKRKLVFYSCF